jgi:hypothetical protein
MKMEKANSRDKKYRKARYGMQVSNRSIFLFDYICGGAPKRSKKKGR